MRETNFVFRKYNGYGCLECNGDFLVFLQYIVGIGEYFFTVINRQGPKKHYFIALEFHWPDIPG